MLYESARDIAAERAAAAKIEQCWRCRVVKLAKCYPVDFPGMVGNHVRFVAEHKRRYCSVRRHPDVPLSCLKIDALFDESTQESAPGVWLSTWDEGLGWYRIDDVRQWPVKWFERKDRPERGKLDGEWCYFVPVSLFSPVVANNHAQNITSRGPVSGFQAISLPTP